MENKHRPYYPVNRTDRPYDESEDNGVSKFEKFSLEILKSLLEKTSIFEDADMGKVVKKANDIAYMMFNAMEQK